MTHEGELMATIDVPVRCYGAEAATLILERISPT
jgi:hypothetical protein